MKRFKILVRSGKMIDFERMLEWLGFTSDKQEPKLHNILIL